MREIFKNVSLSVEGKLMDFRLKKLDAFSGVSLLRMMANLPEKASVADLFFNIWHILQC